MSALTGAGVLPRKRDVDRQEGGRQERILWGGLEQEGLERSHDVSELHA